MRKGVSEREESLGREVQEGITADLSGRGLEVEGVRPGKTALEVQGHELKPAWASDACAVVFGQ